MTKNSISPLSKLVQRVDNFHTTPRINNPDSLTRDNVFGEAFSPSKRTLGIK